MATKVEYPQWAKDIIRLYKASAYNQFLVSGNVNDIFMLPDGTIGTLDDFFLNHMFDPFDVVLTYDIGNGIQCVKGAGIFNPENKSLAYSKTPRSAIESFTEFFRYVTNAAALTKNNRHVAVIIRNTQLVAPNVQGLSYDLNALASLIKEWSTKSEFVRNCIATFLIAENVNDLHPILVGNDHAARIAVPLPSVSELTTYLDVIGSKYSDALNGWKSAELAQQLVGVQLFELDSLLKQRSFDKAALGKTDLVKMRKAIIEKQSDGLIEFIESDRTLDDLIGMDEAKKCVRRYIALWNAGDIRSIPMGILFAAPVGVGKNFFVECIAGEAGIPVVMVKNFRSKWVGDTESKQEKIIRLIRALGRCFVFFDEADATLGKRNSGDGDSGLSQRIYSVWATEMSNSKNRGKIVWILASSRADQIEIDLKRPGRVDVMIPLFPSAKPEEGYAMLKGLCKRESIDLPEDAFEKLSHYEPTPTVTGITPERVNLIPQWLTAGAAESLAKKIYAKVKTENMGVMDAVIDCLRDYRPPIPMSRLEEQIVIAANHTSDIEFIPEVFRKYRTE